MANQVYEVPSMSKLNGKYRELYQRLSQKIPEKRLVTDELLLNAYSIDASVYRLIPKMVIFAESEEEISTILQSCNELEVPATFRAAGTSLSGQALSDSVLIKLGSGWNGSEILEDGKKIRLQPGVIGSQANRALKFYGTRIGPDPASIDAAQIGGIAANNASGMCCGTAQNSYQTVKDLKLVFANGDKLDTSDAISVEEFKVKNSALINKISLISEKLRENPAAAEKIREKFKIKNTTGYSVNAFVDFSDPMEILKHIIIGSEGTLAFISSITYETVTDYNHKAACLLFFKDAKEALKTIPLLINRGIDVGELMDYISLLSVKDKPGMPDYLQKVQPGTLAILTEVKGDSHEDLDRQIAVIEEDFKSLDILHSSGFTSDPDEYKLLWKIRKGMLPSVGGVREKGTSLIIEDVAFPPDHLADGVVELRELLIKHDYTDGIIFGHALAGNVHFVVTQDFDNEKEVKRYSDFIDELTDMVVNKHKGSLKAEHGTGRNMASFVEMEWGEFIYGLMKEIKEAFDPKQILNPGVILNDDREVHLKNFKSTPVTHETIDNCIECGYCEPRCPSAEITFSPRQRIRAWRDINSLKNDKKREQLFKDCEKVFAYYGDKTCAADGLCGVRCPLDINTGLMVKYVREIKTTAAGRIVAQFMADNMRFVVGGLRSLLRLELFAYKFLGNRLLGWITKGMYYLSFKKMPLWGDFMPGPSEYSLRQRAEVTAESPKIVYFPTCLTRAMGPAVRENKKASLINTTMDVLGEMGYEVIFPEGLGDLCCGMPWASKGYKKQGRQKLDELTEALFKASENGKYPVICDASPCAARVKEAVGDRMIMLDQIDFVDRYMMDLIPLKQQRKTIALHSTCTIHKADLVGKLKNIAMACADEVIIPEDVECCGFAGDRGFTVPELNKNALRTLKEAIPENCEEGISTSKSCEIGLSRESEINYNSLMYLVKDSMIKEPETEIEPEKPTMVTTGEKITV